MRPVSCNPWFACKKWDDCHHSGKKIPLKVNTLPHRNSATKYRRQFPLKDPGPRGVSMTWWELPKSQCVVESHWERLQSKYILTPLGIGHVILMSISGQGYYNSPHLKIKNCPQFSDTTNIPVSTLLAKICSQQYLLTTCKFGRPQTHSASQMKRSCG